MKRYTTLRMAIVALAVAAALPAQAQSRGPRGPMSFSALDANGDGVISKAEFDKFRAMRQQQAAAQGRMMRNAGRRPAFSVIDANGDGRITRAEFDKFRAARMGRNR